ncbi:hypothetical protein A7J42_11715 [Brucella intermedia]|nr:hypothetical protein A7J42_11715 [Brucella intermedia]
MIDAIDAVFQLLALAHQLLGFLGIIPECGIFSFLVEIAETFYRLIPVKDASSAGLWPAGFRQPASRFPRAWANRSFNIILFN